jgi:GMP synthase-like glutamine amidotransferase
MAKKIVVFQHNPWEGPGTHLVSASARHNLKMEIIRVWKQDIPDVTSYDAMIVLGGGPNVDQEKTYPFLVEEKNAIQKAVANDLPYLGFCLGHQLLANVMGAKVGPNHQSSIGFIKGFLTHEGKKHPLFDQLPQSMTLLKWHGQSVQEPLPTNMNILATSAECLIEAISLEERPHIVGLQFDNHAATPENVKHWLTMDSKWLSSLADKQIDPAAILADAQKKCDAMGKQFAKLFDNFFSLIQ